MSESSTTAPSTMKDPPAASLPATPSGRSDVASLPPAATQSNRSENVPLPILRAEANLSEKQIWMAADNNSSEDEATITKKESVRLYEESLYADKAEKAADKTAADNIDGLLPCRQEPIPGPPELRSAANISMSAAKPGAFPVAGVSARGDGFLGGVFEENNIEQNVRQPTEVQESLEIIIANVINNDEYPIEASVVDDEDYEDASVHHRSQVLEDLEEATNVKPLPPRPPEGRSKVGVFTIILLPFLGVVLAIVLIPTLSQDDSKETHEASTQEQNQQEIPLDQESITATYPPFDNSSTLHHSTFTDILDNPGSPRWKANNWMWEDPLFQSYPSWRQHQRFAMAVIYYSTDGDNWLQNDHWLSYSAPEWGTLPSEIQIPSTKIVDYSHNNISGYLPQLVDNNHFEQFILSNNSLSPFPVVADSGLIGEYRKVIRIDSNNIEFKNMGLLRVFPNLEVLNMTKNVIASTLPTEVQLTPNLIYLGIGDNLCMGTIPTELGLLPALTGLDISDNLALEGTLPTELGLLSSLVDLDVSNNMALNGTLPEELRDLKNLSRLDISGTSTTGIIPMVLCSRNNSGSLELIADCSQMECC
ncbi:Leucine Rich Repeat [Seminavis robusta]|uniref:Leucine Rich Repeat n=1 Tax=Seminavis robusta TaxID=568900 RepID=A0A9N8HIZ7_9STRA|nr:Leucine Rich Repeat [Seminavis robusta]|eukprot:Sro730_g194130.1 Leucine Rich Repeat (592) ;mRNA; f:45684-47540